MDFTLSTQDNVQIELFREVPASLNRYRIPGAGEYYAAGDFGSLLFHQQQGAGFSLWHKQYTVRQNTFLSETPAKPLFLLYVAINRPLRFQQAGWGKLVLPEGQFNIVYTPAAARELWLEKGKKYTLYEIQFSSTMLEKLVPWFSLLPEFLMKAELGAPCQLNPSHARITPVMLSILYNMLHCGYMGTAREMYLEALLSRLLLQAVTRLTPSRVAINERKLQPYELNKLREAWEYLLRNLDRPGTMAELAHAIGLNEFKLKRGFKQLYGVTIFEFLLEARMEKAKRLLEETNMTVHAVGISVGYKNISSFTVAFKKKFSQLPSDVKAQIQ